MTFKEFAKGVAYLPADAFTGIVNLVLGSTKKHKDGSIKLDYNDEPKTNPSLLGLAADGIKFVGRTIADFLSNHKKAIATAAWLSLATAGAIALTLFLSPAALTAVASFSIYGFSIAGIAGANALAQIGVASLLAAAAVSAVTYIGAAAGNFVKWLAECCKSLKSNAPESAPTHNEDAEPTLEEQDEFSYTKSKGQMSGLLQQDEDELSSKEQEKSATVVRLPTDRTVEHFSSPLLKTKVTKSQEDLLTLEDDSTQSFNPLKKSN